ncbi:MAG: hypothetical protein EOP04_30285, partial [Proteobacteria bacterium]
LQNLSYMLLKTESDAAFTELYPCVSSSNLDFMDVMVFHFASQLRQALKRKVVLRYVEREENLSIVTGKINFTKDLRHNLVDRSKIYCEFDELSAANIIMQTLKHVAIEMLPFASRQETSSMLNACISNMPTIDAKRFSNQSIRNVSLGNQNAIYRDCWKLALLFLLGDSPDLVRGGRNSVSLVFDMNVLFENFIAYILDSNRDRLGIKSVRTQHPTSIYDHAISISDPEVKFRTKQSGRLDLFIVMKNGRRLILDTKYKRVKTSQNQIEKLSVNDLYQMFSYSHFHEEDGEVLSTVLVYPEDTVGFEVKLVNSEKNINWHAVSVNLHESFIAAEMRLIERFSSIFSNITGSK